MSHPAQPAQQEIEPLIALFQAGRYAELENQAQALIECYPESGRAWKILGTALGVQSKNALPALQRAVALLPNDASIHNNLGNVWQDMGQYDNAVASYRRALEIEPDFAAVHNNLGKVRNYLEQHNDAAASFRRALEIDPVYADAHYNLGNALQSLGQLDEAIVSYQQALALSPGFSEAHYNLGNAWQSLGRLDAALESYRQALVLRPDFSDACSNLLFVLNYTASHATLSSLEEAQVYGQIVAKQVDVLFSTWQCVAEPERLRVGVVSGDLRHHPVGYALENLLIQLDPTRVELIAYSANPKVDELTARIQPYFADWKTIYGKSNADAARMIHADGLHILLDLSGHTTHSRLPVFAWKPAPIQASWLGYFATTGVAEMDYLLTSEVAAPEAHRTHFTESIWFLPDIWLCFTPPKPDLPVTTLPAQINGHLTFGCFQRVDKISDAVLKAWGSILAALPTAQMNLANKQLGKLTMAAQFRQRLQQYGIDPTRVQLQGAAGSREEYLARYTEVDVMLDTFPYPGVTTTCEALWMGVPTLTLVGDTLLSRQGAGMLVPAGLSDWVATSEVEYVEKAIRLTSELPKLATLRAGLRQQVLTSPVYDAPRFARNFEAALWGMWQAWREKQ